MTIKLKAREIAERVEEEHGSYWGLPEAARLGIIEGVKMAEQAVSQALTYGAKDAAIRAIRALIEEQKL